MEHQLRIYFQIFVILTLENEIITNTNIIFNVSEDDILYQNANAVVDKLIYHQSSDYVLLNELNSEVFFVKLTE